MTTEKSLILDAVQVKQKIRRMAFEIYERNVKEKTIVLAGIDGQGYVLAKLLAKEVANISPLEVKLVLLHLDKSAPAQSEITVDCDLKELRKKCIVLVDDVLNTGRTFTYGIKPFLDTEVKKIEVAVLVDRGLTIFPVHAQYTGYELSTTIKDHIEVVLGKDTAVYLH
ncbi:phosphoribosyltransferase family protein [Pseudochryseolinea flava]|uniref:Phosphoribosyltransferase n=1 Tax=Pseudochryseolinea flava TaxID=2059302 RepID=A0A364Y6C0_9BACT|nr:phosphoribosyltransferase family protein [Pseudochryseolinea flava]RAW02644.1 phosphoribosyltransferase [Pseudochryseolinea flava]